MSWPSRAPRKRNSGRACAPRRPGQCAMYGPASATSTAGSPMSRPTSPARTAAWRARSNSCAEAGPRGRDMGIWEFLVVGSAISTVGWVANNWIKARHGYPIDDEKEAPDKRRMDAIWAENGQLKSEIGRLEARLAVLERIATD